MTAELGHATGRFYVDQNGNPHMNGATFYDSNESAMSPVAMQSQAVVVSALTDNGGGASADGTIGVVTAPTAITDSSGGTASATLAALGTVSTSGGNTYADSAINAKLTILGNAIASIAARQAENRTAIVALTDAVKELSTKQNAVLTSLKNSTLMASS